MLEAAGNYRQINPARRRRTGGLDAALTVDDLRLLARRRLPAFLYEFIEGGADAERTLRRNAAVFDDYRWLPRMAVDTAFVDVATNLFGASLTMPMVVAPMGFNGMSWHRGDRAIAEAAAVAGIPMAQSTASMLALEDVASVPNLHHWFQLYPYGDDAVLRRLLGRARDAGSEVLAVTVDGAVAGNRTWDQRSFRAPGRLTLRSKLESLRHPRWLWDVILRRGAPNFVNLAEFAGGQAPNIYAVGRWMAANRPHLNWDRLARIRDLWPGTLLVKGILRVDEAREAVARGAQGIVLSNHGGRQVDPTVSPLDVLPTIRNALGRDFPILIDSGYRTGNHVALALALGADAVLIGRPALYGLAAAGRAGVERALAILRGELIRAMALIGARGLRDLQPHYVQNAPIVSKGEGHDDRF
jgi:(S)-mandelate dehydrogenase